MYLNVCTNTMQILNNRIDQGELCDIFKQLQVDINKEEKKEETEVGLQSSVRMHESVYKEVERKVEHSEMVNNKSKIGGLHLM